MTQNEIIVVSIKKCQVAQKAYLADPKNKELEETWIKYSHAVETLAEIFEEAKS